MPRNHIAERALHNKYVRARWSAYLSDLLTQGHHSKSKVADALELQQSRVNAWVTGTRAVSPSIAFDVAERLCDQLSVPTSGPESLYACGYFVELLRLFNHLASNYEAEGNELAVLLYCWLPAHMLRYESMWWDRQFMAAIKAKSDAVQRALLRYGREWQLLETEIALARRDSRALPADISKRLRATSVRRLISKAWSDSNRGELRVTTKVRKFDHTQVVLGRPVHVSGMEWHGQLWPDDGNELIDWVLGLYDRFAGVVPSLVSPRLWRLIAEWAYIRDPATFENNKHILPWPYRTFEPRELSDEERGYLEWLQWERERLRGK